MRQVYVDNSEDNHIQKISFYSPSSGYVAFVDWIGHTTDSGRTFIKKFITSGNVDYGPYFVNLTFGFIINGVKAFDKDNIIVYGHYGLVPAILTSSNGGNTFKLVYHSQFQPMEWRTGITDLAFLPDNKTGYAIDADRILKTTNGGLSWNNALVSPGSYFEHIQANRNQITVLSTGNETNKLVRSIDGGGTWKSIQFPQLDGGKMTYSYFLNSTMGWLNITDVDHNGYIYKTTNGGDSWQLLNNIRATRFSFGKIIFTDESIGYALSGLFTVFKTMDGGATWEPLPRDNDYSYLFYHHNDIQCLNSSQLWAGGGHGFLEMSNNGGGTPLPIAYFDIDTAGVSSGENVQLLNYSRPGYSNRWLLNGQQISTSYHASYTHDINRTSDTITLIVSNGINADTATKYQWFHPPVTISSFSPESAHTGQSVTITGTSFLNVKSVTFGGVPAASFHVTSSTSIVAVVGSGASGDIQVNTPTGTGSKSGFTFIPPPVIASFSPASATYNTPVTINGNNFVNVTSVKIGGVPAVSYQIISPSEIVAHAPSGPDGTIVVTTDGGTHSLPGYSSIPTINSFTPKQGTHGTLLQISGTSFDGVSAVSVGGVDALYFTLNSSNSITAIVGAGSTGEVKVVKHSGTSSATGFTWNAPPAVTGFSPTSGPIGTTVTITGTGFNPVANLNTVYFGAVKATVSSASATSLVVKVPAGATFEKMSVTNHSLTAYSNYPFLVTFSDGGSIAPGSFTPALNLAVQPLAPTDIVVADLDTDGKPDLIVVQYSFDNSADDGLLLYRNTSTSSTVSFAQPVTLTGLSYGEVKFADIDGDGKMDIISMKEAAIVVLRNLSTPGNLSFSEGFELSNSANSVNLAVSDIDGDGKPDIISGGKAFRNVSEPGSVNFAAPVETGAGGGRNIFIADINGDQKDDIILSEVGILINQSTKGNISFKGLIPLSARTTQYTVAGDIDGDGKVDLVIANRSGSTLSIMRNTSDGDNISFDAPVDFPAPFYPGGIALSDMDGDGKLDIVTAPENHGVGILKNVSTPGNISFAPQISYLPGRFRYPHRVALADLNGDGKNDIVSVSAPDQRIDVFLNTVEPIPFIQSFTPSTGIDGTLITITGANFTGATSVKFGGIEASSFTVISSTTITAVVGSGASGDITITTNRGTGSIPGFIYATLPAISSVSPLKGDVGDIITINGTSFSSMPGDNIVSFGGVRARVLTASPTQITVRVPFGSLYKPISVTVAGITAWSTESFLTTFPNGGEKFNDKSFAPRLDISDANILGMTDIDGDGKIDMISTYLNTVSVRLNTGTTANISFALPHRTQIPERINLTGQADFDGDGKTDIALITDKFKLFFLRNTSAPGSISFDSPTQYGRSLTIDTRALDIADLDGDGKPDIVTTSYNNFAISVFTNSSTKGNISFSAHFDLNIEHYGTQVFLRDLNGDGKPEIICLGGGSFYVFKNTSTPGNISFGSRISFPLSGEAFAVSDIDGDGKIDVVGMERNSFSILRNISTSGEIKFASSVTFPNTKYSILHKLDVNDLDGDGKPDLYSVTDEIVSVYKNTSVPGTISFDAGIDYDGNGGLWSITACDLDGDGKADLSISGNGVMILRNTSGNDEGPEILSFSPISSVQGETITISGNKFTGATDVSIGDVAASSFKVISDHEISVVLDSGATGAVVVTTASGKASLTGFTYGNKPIITGIFPLSATAGSPVTINGANLSSVISVSFGGTPAESFIIDSPTSIAAIVGDGASGKVTITTADATVEHDGFRLLSTPTITSFTPASGRNGAEVSITGTNFYDVLSVTFGGYPAKSIKVISPTLIKAMIDNGVSGEVSVITEAGKANLDGYTYLAPSKIHSFYPTSAGEGTTVIINGFNFGAVTNVMFGDSPASSFRIETPSRIIATVGAGSSGNVSVTTVQGTYRLAGFTYVANSQPFISSFAPATGGKGSIITINGSGFTNTTEVSFNNFPATSFKIVSDFTIEATVGTGASGKVSVTTDGGVHTSDGFIFTHSPVISSFTPLKAEEGATISIKGANFSSDPKNNIVYFGTVKGAVTSASENQLTVRVPQGAIFRPISVTTGGFTGYSNQYFLPLYANSGPLQAISYASRMDSTTGKLPKKVNVGDIDGDAKLDITVVGGDKFNIGHITTFRNESEPALFKLGKKEIKPVSDSPLSGLLADLDGDGLLDLVAALPFDVTAVRVYQNASEAGKIIFNEGPTLDFGLGQFMAGVADFDNDGKPDIAVVGNYTGAVAVYKNASTGNSIHFSDRTTVSVPTFNRDLLITDVDLDGKPDIIVLGGGVLHVLRNTSIRGKISFETTASDQIAIYGTRIKVGDLDGDGIADFILNTDDGVMVIKNKSIPGYIQFDVPVSFATGGRPNSIEMADMDGNGLMDIVVSHGNISTLGILQNTGSPGNISFDPVVTYTTGTATNDINVVDIDGDGRPDIITANTLSSSISIFKQQSSGPADRIIILCEDSDTSLTSNITGATYQWQQNTGTGFMNISDNSDVSGVNSPVLRLKDIPNGFDKYRYRCIVDGKSSSTVFKLNIKESVMPAISILALDTTICGGTLLVLNSSANNGGDHPVYDWKRNGVSLGINDDQFSAANVAHGDIITVTLTSNALCASRSSVTSNPVRVTHFQKATVSITGNSVVAPGKPATLTSTVVDGGKEVEYQWQDSTSTHSWKDIAGATKQSIRYMPANSGDKIRCVVVSDGNCADGNPVYSNVVEMIIADAEGKPHIKYYPNPANSFLIIDSLKLEDNWKTLQIVSTDGTPVLQQEINGKTSVTIQLENLRSGVYIIILRRKDGESAYLKFVKI